MTFILNLDCFKNDVQAELYHRHRGKLNGPNNSIAYTDPLSIIADLELCQILRRTT